jgi:hypothetical protein
MLGWAVQALSFRGAEEQPSVLGSTTPRHPTPEARHVEPSMLGWAVQALSFRGTEEQPSVLGSTTPRTPRPKRGA